jgi:hypothetical protein
MCCVGLDWSVLHPSWLRSRKNGRKRECVCVFEMLAVEGRLRSE